ncbi:isochorismate synthase [Bacillus kwashiorkori]|uniref:isochorismate synthase n=1 Tax=Bacillus kwashiorkori TaxID=1522318 RepID=UPI000785391C|nr:isochorismate synthase [Bacillus kwashiorkori]
MALDGHSSLTINKLLENGIQKAQEKDSNILISMVNKINFYPKNPYLKGQKFFWKDKSTSIYGFGFVKCIKIGATDDRFKEVSDQWEQIRANAIIDNPFEEQAVGPLLFGSLSFDHVHLDNQLWKNFQNGLFYIPEFMITVTENGSFLTINIVCTNKSDPLELTNQLIEKREKIINCIKKQTDNYIRLEEMEPKILDDQADKWINNVQEAITLLNDHYLQKVVLAREIRLAFDNDISNEHIIQKLVSEQQDSYVFALESKEDIFIGASPERLVKKIGTKVFSSCVAGSAKRGSNKDEDNFLGEQLLNDKKNLAEHQFVVQMITDAFFKYCDSIKKPNRPDLMKIRDIQHLYTPVEGRLMDHHTIFDLVSELHPTPALGGTPKETALSLIRDLELFERGMYAAPIGWVDYRGNGEFVVGIRSGLLQGKEASIFAGCGIVKDSDPQLEYEETNIKFRPMLRLLGGQLDD